MLGTFKTQRVVKISKEIINDNMEHVSIYNPTNLSLTNNLYKEIKKSKKIIAVSNACPNNP